MSTPSSPWPGLSVTLYVRGFLLLAVSAIAIRWPEETLLGMTAVAGGLVALFGVIEHAMVIGSDASARLKGLVSLHAFLSLFVGAVAIAATLIPHPDPSLPGLLYLGASCTAVYAVLQIAAALWIRNETALARAGSGLGSRPDRQLTMAAHPHGIAP
jgi:hypothetical protein